MRATSVLAAVFLVCAAGSALAAATLTLVNRSSFAIHHLYLSPSAQEDWGPDQIGEDILDPGARFELRSVPVDVYDVRLVDEDGDECIIAEVDIAETQQWVISDSELLQCEGFGQ